MADVSVEVVALLTSLDSSGETRPTLHEVFTALPSVPKKFVIYVEFRHQESFAYAIRISSSISLASLESEHRLILDHPAKRISEVIPVELDVETLPAGAYNIEVIAIDSGDQLARRQVFFGEM